MLRSPSGVEWRAVLGRHIGGVDDVLDRYREAVKRLQRLPLPLLLVSRLGLGEHLFRLDVDKGADLRLAFLDAFEKGPGDVDGAKVSPAMRSRSSTAVSRRRLSSAASLDARPVADVMEGDPPDAAPQRSDHPRSPF